MEKLLREILKKLGEQKNVEEFVDRQLEVDPLDNLFEDINPAEAGDDVETKFNKIQDKFEDKVEQLAMAGASRACAKKVWTQYNVMNTLYQSKARAEGHKVVERDISMKWKQASSLMYRCFKVQTN